MRFGRAGVPVFHDEASYTFQIGKGEVLRRGTDVAVIANGLMVAEALAAAETLAGMGISARVINMATIKPLDEELVLQAAKTCGKGHHLRGAQHHRRSGRGRVQPAQREVPHSGAPHRCQRRVRSLRPRRALLKQFGLSAEHIVEVAKDFCGK